MINSKSSYGQPTFSQIPKLIDALTFMVQTTHHENDGSSNIFLLKICALNLILDT
jgi:hypothetical protein